MTEAIIETRDLTKRLSGGQVRRSSVAPARSELDRGGKTIVDRLNLSVPRGAIFALLGDNGAGKTTTMRMLVGLLQADGASSARTAGRPRQRCGGGWPTCPRSRVSTIG